MIDIKHIEPSKFNINQTVFYAFFAENVVEGRITDIDLSLGQDGVSYTYGLITDEGKTYRASELSLFNEYQLAFDVVKIGFMDAIMQEQKAIDHLNSRIPELKNLILTFKETQLSENIPMFGYNVNYFNKNDVVFVVPNLYDFNCDLNTPYCFNALIQKITGHISTKHPEKNRLVYTVDIDFKSDHFNYAGKHPESHIFSSECEALSFCLSLFESSIQTKQSKIDKINKLIAANS